MNWQQAALCVAAGAVGGVAALIGAAWAGAYMLAVDEAKPSEALERYRREEALRAVGRVLP